MDFEERRKAQNRAAQRKYRKKLQRLKETQEQEQEATDVSTPSSGTHNGSSAPESNSFERTTSPVDITTHPNYQIISLGHHEKQSTPSDSDPAFIDQFVTLMAGSEPSFPQSGSGTMSPATIPFSANNTFQPSTNNPMLCFPDDNFDSNILDSASSRIAQWLPDNSLFDIQPDQIQFISNAFKTIPRTYQTETPISHSLDMESEYMADIKASKKAIEIEKRNHRLGSRSQIGRKGTSLKQRAHMRNKIQQMVAKLVELYDLGVGLELCARDPGFKRALIEMRSRFIELLSLDGEDDTSEASDS